MTLEMYNAPPTKFEILKVSKCYLIRKHNIYYAISLYIVKRVDNNNW